MNRRREPKVGISLQVTEKERELINKVALAQYDSVSSWVRANAKQQARKLGLEVVCESV